MDNKLSYTLTMRLSDGRFITVGNSYPTYGTAVDEANRLGMSKEPRITLTDHANYLHIVNTDHIVCLTVARTRKII